MACVHCDVHHPLHHGPDFIWQTDHFKWTYCVDYLIANGVALPAAGGGDDAEFDVLGIDDLAKKETKPTRGLDLLKRLVFLWRGRSRASRDDDAAAAAAAAGSLVLQLPVKPSNDPRHGGRIPVCDNISYDGWMIRRSCRGCEDYWMGWVAWAGWDGSEREP